VLEQLDAGADYVVEAGLAPRPPWRACAHTAEARHDGDAVAVRRRARDEVRRVAFRDIHSRSRMASACSRRRRSNQPEQGFPMISVTRLDGTPMIVNCDQIAWIEYVPDTVISLMNGEKLIVGERPETIVERVHEFRRAISGVRRTGQVISGLTLATDAGGDR
jgi:uncharacterized protein YlzI (FlbEa/FlbD family)